MKSSKRGRIIPKEGWLKIIAEDIEKSRKILGLGSTSTLKEIKDAYRTLARETHPDNGGNAERFVEIKNAHQRIMDYVKDYKYSFKPDDVMAQRTFERIRDNYMQDPIWSNARDIREDE